MSERYKRWFEIFKHIHQHLPTKEEIDLIAPSHIKTEYYELHPQKKKLRKMLPQVKLRRSYDNSDRLPEVIRMHGICDMITLDDEILRQINLDAPLRRSPRKHASSTSSQTVLRQMSSASKLSVRQNPYIQKTSANMQKSVPNFVIPKLEESKPLKDPTQIGSYDHMLRRSPRKHPSSRRETLLSPQKPFLVSKLISNRRVSTVVDALGKADYEKENIANDVFAVKDCKENENQISDRNKEEACGSKVNESPKKNPFRNEKICLKGGMQKQQQNYRRLKMKKSFIRGTSSSKIKYRKWRKTRNKR
ncbi:unnamed protein product [Thelazia callipaeda]|uniref:Uncharacterized protein n=1 Tax=Thelazia callipaeda TaxID=103827 RepID=A0A158RB31_THECL|nr:unnamed protein product [Thelazia callipaeda]